MVSAVSDEKVRTRAYELWLEAGSPDGRDEEFWQQSKSQLPSPSAPTQGTLSRIQMDSPLRRLRTSQSSSAEGASTATETVRFGRRLPRRPITLPTRALT
jgi:hypothetical protein